MNLTKTGRLSVTWKIVLIVLPIVTALIALGIGRYFMTPAEVMEAIKDTQLIAEINTKSLFKHQRTFPHQRYYRQLKMMEIPVVINSDVHMPELINAGREETISKYNNL